MTCSSTFLKYQAGKMSPFYPLGISRIGPASKSSLLGHVIIHLLTKLVRSRWLNIGLIHFCIFIDQDQAVLCGPWHLLCNFCSQVTRKSLLFHRNISSFVGNTGFHKLRVLDCLQFFLEHSLARGRQGQ